jgi:outer membrane beta-barrel protein
MMSKAVCLLSLLLSTATSLAASPIKFPDGELPQETVMPVFDRKDVVLNRAVVTEKRFEVGLLGGWTPTDPFFSPLSYGASAGYHFDETHGVNVMFANRLGGTTEYTDQLNNVRNTPPLRLQNAPAPTYIALANYQASLFYGKMSFSKSVVGNLSLFATAGAGVLGLGDGTLPVASLGLGQKYYLTDSFGLRLDVRMLAYEGPDVVSRSLTDTKRTPTNSFFDKKLLFDSMLTLSAIFMFPGS